MNIPKDASVTIGDLSRLPKKVRVNGRLDIAFDSTLDALLGCEELACISFAASHFYVFRAAREFKTSIILRSKALIVFLLSEMGPKVKFLGMLRRITLAPGASIVVSYFNMNAGSMLDGSVFDKFDVFHSTLTLTGGNELLLTNHGDEAALNRRYDGSSEVSGPLKLNRKDFNK